MNPTIKAFWERLNCIFQAFALKLTTDNFGLEQLIGNDNNESFPLRAYLTFLKHKAGDEISLTVDIKSLNDGFRIDSDIAGEDGFVLADGPSLELTGNIDENLHNQEIDKWFDDFENFLIDKYDDVLTALRNLD